MQTYAAQTFPAVLDPNATKEGLGALALMGALLGDSGREREGILLSIMQGVVKDAFRQAFYAGIAAGREMKCEDFRAQMGLSVEYRDPEYDLEQYMLRFLKDEAATLRLKPEDYAGIDPNWRTVNFKDLGD